MKRIILACLSTCLGACTSVSTQYRPDSYYHDTAPTQAESTQSLFSSDSAVLSDASIEQILSHRFTFRPNNHIAILKVGSYYSWASWSSDFADAERSLKKRLSERLMTSYKVYGASFLPDLLVPERKSVPFLREAAARYQANLLLIYQSSCDSFEKARFLSPDIARAYCNVEAVLLDTRTGIVPFTAQRSKEDLDFSETLRKTELESTAQALEELAELILTFMDT